MPFNSNDLKAGRIPPRTVYGVEIPPALRVGEMTLRERHDRNRSLNERPVSREEAERVGYRPDEIEEVFGK